MLRNVVVRRKWIGRQFCRSEIVGEGLYLNGYVWYGDRRPRRDSQFHEMIDYKVREILKEKTGKTTGEVVVDIEDLKRHLEDLREYALNVGLRSWRSGEVLTILS
ncbi:MAG: hypothetical protein ACXQS5_02330 [Candidatus Methanospirareceae archaeon]